MSNEVGGAGHAFVPPMNLLRAWLVTPTGSIIEVHVLGILGMSTYTVFDVIVVGAGVEGSATAYQLIKHGAKRVLLLEQVQTGPFHANKSLIYVISHVSFVMTSHTQTCTSQYLSLEHTAKFAHIFQFSSLHSRGSSHGSSRVTRRAYTKPYYVQMVDDSYAMWDELERESRTQLFMYVYLFHLQGEMIMQ